MADRQLPRPSAPRSLAAVALEQWLTDRGIAQSDIAARLGLTRAAISAYVRGLNLPKLTAARTLQRLSKGRVALADWRVAAK